MTVKMRKQYQVIVCEIMNLIIELLNVVYVAKTVPTDYRTDNRKHERGRDDHANINNANDHITDNGSKSTYKVFWGMLGVAILVGIIAIACFYGSGFLYEGTCVFSYYYFLLTVTSKLHMGMPRHFQVQTLYE